MSEYPKPTQLRLPPQAVPVERPASPGGVRPTGVGPSFSDPCESAGSYDEWLSCHEELDPWILY